MLPLQDISQFEKYGTVSKILLVIRLIVWYSHFDLYIYSMVCRKTSGESVPTSAVHVPCFCMKVICFPYIDI